MLTAPLVLAAIALSVVAFVCAYGCGRDYDKMSPGETVLFFALGIACGLIALWCGVSAVAVNLPAPH